MVRVLGLSLCLSLGVTNAATLSFPAGTEATSLLGILLILSFIAFLIVTSAGLTGPFVADAAIYKASAMPTMSSIRLAKADHHYTQATAIA